MASQLVTVLDQARDADFRNTGNCAKPNVDPEVFFDEYSRSLSVAKQICASCPVRQPCLEYAVEHAEQGVWAGTSERDRRAIRVERIRAKRGLA